MRVPKLGRAMHATHTTTAPSTFPFPSPRAAARLWHLQLMRRIGRLWPLKALGTTVGIAGFFFVYFWVMHNPPSLPQTMPLTPLDAWVRTSDKAMWLYGSLWFYISLAPALARDRMELFAHARSAALMAAIGLAAFWFHPTVVPLFAVDWSQYPSLQFLKATDAGGNAFPSLHVAFAVFSAVAIARQLRCVRAPAWTQALNALWAAGIVWSTLATRQHVVLDVLGGVLLAVMVCWVGTPRRR